MFKPKSQKKRSWRVIEAIAPVLLTTSIHLLSSHFQKVYNTPGVVLALRIPRWIGIIPALRLLTSHERQKEESTDTGNTLWKRQCNRLSRGLHGQDLTLRLDGGRTGGWGLLPGGCDLDESWGKVGICLTKAWGKNFLELCCLIW